MSTRKTLLSASILAALLSVGSAWAAESGVAPQADQQTSSEQNNQNEQDEQDTNERDVQELGTIIVTGIRESAAASLEMKKYATAHLEVVTAEDIGKLPAKNVADTLQRLPGVNISSASASEGGFDENDRVSLRGTNPSLTKTLINGHTVGTGDWFVLSQVQTVGRSVSYTLLPAEIVSRVVIKKTPTAKDIEGGTAGTVNIITRTPLQFADPITAEVSLGGVYSSLPSETQPQASALFNWKNASDTMGFLVQGFYEERSLERQGQEVVGGYLPIAADSAIAQAHPDLAGVLYPNLLGAVLFTQVRKRTGGVLDFEIKPTENFSLNLNAFYSKLEADNYNRNFMMWGSHGFVAAGEGLQDYTVNNGVLTSANFAPVPGSTTAYGVYDQISRPGAGSKTSFVALDAHWQASDRLYFDAQAGITRGEGQSPVQDVLELGTAVGGGASWNMNGLDPIDWNLGGDHSTPAGIQPTSGWIFGELGINVTDDEDWFKVDGELVFGSGALESLQFGVRYADHTRENLSSIAQGPKGDWQNLANYPNSWSNYPSDFCSNVGADCPSDIFYYTEEQLAAFNAQFANRDPVARFYFNDIYSVNEKSTAAYGQLNFSGLNWSANVGVRYVTTEEDISYSSTSPQEAIVEGPISGSAFGDYYWNTFSDDYSEALPSANVKWNITDDFIARFSASKTMTRPNFSALAGFVSLDDLTHTGSGGNPKLKPIVSNNVDLALEWYFAPRGLLSAGVYSMDLNDYVTFSNVSREYKDMQASNDAGQDVFSTYLVSVPANVGAKVQGVELNYIQPIGDNFGFLANYTYADGEVSGGGPLAGASENTWNVSGYYENAKFNARLSYTYRSEFFAGVSRTDTFYQDGVGNLAASVNYNVTDNLAVSLNAMNLNDPTLSYYTVIEGSGKLPHATYVNGRQYYLNLRYRF